MLLFFNFYFNAHNEKRNKSSIHLRLLVHEVLTNAGVAAGARGTLIDVFLTAKARKSHLTITAGREKSLILIFCLRWEKEDLSVSHWPIARNEQKSLQV